MYCKCKSINQIFINESLSVNCFAPAVLLACPLLLTQTVQHKMSPINAMRRP